MSLERFTDVLLQRLGVMGLFVAFLASCDDPIRPNSFSVTVASEPSVMTGERETGVNEGNVLCRYVVRATIDGDAGATAQWLNSRIVLQHSGGHSDTLNISVEETVQFWSREVISNSTVLRRDWAWGGPEGLTPVIVETTYFYQVRGREAPDSARYTFQCH